jgi:hypothetical protein
MRYSLCCLLLTGLLAIALSRPAVADSSAANFSATSVAYLPAMADSPALSANLEQNEEWANESDLAPAPVPEPSSSALFGFGILFMLYLIRRRHLAMAS